MKSLTFLAAAVVILWTVHGQAQGLKGNLGGPGQLRTPRGPKAPASVQANVQGVTGEPAGPGNLQPPGGSKNPSNAQAQMQVVTGDLEGPDYLQPPKYYRTLSMMLKHAANSRLKGPPPVAVSGTRQLLVILVQLSDATPDAAHTTAYFDDRFFDTNPPSVVDYYTEVSYGNFTYARAAVLGWYNHAYTMAQWDADPRTVARAAIQAADADFNYAPYDTSGDGTVTNEELTIFIIVSGTAGGAFHWWTTSAVAADGVNVEGEFSATHENRHIGSYCHELGHDLGLPDLYDTSDPARSEGIGNFGLMGGGSWTFAQMTAWSKIQLGWITPTIVTSFDCVDVRDSETHAEAYVVCDPTYSTDEYFLVENKWPANSDYEMIGAPVAPSGTYPDTGIIIYHIDEAQMQGWITSGDNDVNADETRKGVDVETPEHPTSHVVDADDLDAQVNRGDADDLWDDGEYRFDDNATPCNANWYVTTTSGVRIGGFSPAGPTMSVCFFNDPPVAVCQSPQPLESDGACCALIGVAEIDGGSYDPNGAANIESLCITAVDGSPVGCQATVSLCGTGTHSLTLTITDEAGESASCDTTVEVLDVTPPQISCPPDVTVTCGESTDPAATGEATATDNCDAAPVIAYVDAETWPPCPADPVMKTIARTWQATDYSGNQSSCIQTITVLKVVLHLDIKPGSCPNPFNVGSRGVQPIAVVGTPGFDVGAIDVSSIRLSRGDCVGGTVGPRVGAKGGLALMADVATPFDGPLCGCHGLGGDGIADLLMHFTTEDIVSALALNSVPDGAVLELVVTGELVGGCRFRAADCVVVNKPKGTPRLSNR